MMTKKTNWLSEKGAFLRDYSLSVRAVNRTN